MKHWTTAEIEKLSKEIELFETHQSPDSVRLWIELCSALYIIKYNNSDKPKSFIDRYNKAKKKLFELKPIGFDACKYTVIGRGQAYMGEDIYIFENDIGHAIHLRHTKCETYAVTWTRVEPLSLYCGFCGCRITREECT